MIHSKAGENTKPGTSAFVLRILGENSHCAVAEAGTPVPSVIYNLILANPVCHYLVAKFHCTVFGNRTSDVDRPIKGTWNKS